MKTWIGLIALVSSIIFGLELLASVIRLLITRGRPEEQCYETSAEHLGWTLMVGLSCLFITWLAWWSHV